MRYFEKLTYSAILPSSQDIGRPKRTNGQALVVFFGCVVRIHSLNMPTRRATRSFREHILLVADFPRLCLPSFFHVIFFAWAPLTFEIWFSPRPWVFVRWKTDRWSLGFRITGGFGTISPSPVGKSARFLLVASLWFLPSPAQFPGHFILREVPGLLLYLRQMTSRLLAERLRAKWNTQPMEKFPCIQYTNFWIPPPKQVDPVTYTNPTSLLYCFPYLSSDKTQVVVSCSCRKTSPNGPMTWGALHCTTTAF